MAESVRTTQTKLISNTIYLAAGTNFGVVYVWILSYADVVNMLSRGDRTSAVLDDGRKLHTMVQTSDRPIVKVTLSSYFDPTPDLPEKVISFGADNVDAGAGEAHDDILLAMKIAPQERAILAASDVAGIVRMHCESDLAGDFDIPANLAGLGDAQPGTLTMAALQARNEQLEAEARAVEEGASSDNNNKKMSSKVKKDDEVSSVSSKSSFASKRSGRSGRSGKSGSSRRRKGRKRAGRPRAENGMDLGLGAMVPCGEATYDSAVVACTFQSGSAARLRSAPTASGQPPTLTLTPSGAVAAGVADISDSALHSKRDASLLVCTLKGQLARYAASSLLQLYARQINQTPAGTVPAEAGAEPRKGVRFGGVGDEDHPGELVISCHYAYYFASYFTFSFLPFLFFHLLLQPLLLTRGGSLLPTVLLRLLSRLLHLTFLLPLRAALPLGLH